MAQNLRHKLKNLTQPISKFESFVTSQDLFGHGIHLNFNGIGNSYRTVIGGSLSFIIKFMMTLYIFYNVK